MESFADIWIGRNNFENRKVHCHRWFCIISGTWPDPNLKFWFGLWFTNNHSKNQMEDIKSNHAHMKQALTVRSLDNFEIIYQKKCFQL